MLQSINPSTNIKYICSIAFIEYMISIKKGLKRDALKKTLYFGVTHVDWTPCRNKDTVYSILCNNNGCQSWSIVDFCQSSIKFSLVLLPIFRKQAILYFLTSGMKFGKGGSLTTSIPGFCWFCGQVEHIWLRHSYLLFSIWHIGNWQLHLHESRRTEIRERTWWFVSLSAITILKISLSQKKFLLNSACQYYMSEVYCICTHHWKAQSQHVFSNDHFFYERNLIFFSPEIFYELTISLLTLSQWCTNGYLSCIWLRWDIDHLLWGVGRYL